MALKPYATPDEILQLGVRALSGAPWRIGPYRLVLDDGLRDSNPLRDAG